MRAPPDPAPRMSALGRVPPRVLSRLALLVLGIWLGSRVGLALISLRLYGTPTLAMPPEASALLIAMTVGVAHLEVRRSHGPLFMENLGLGPGRRTLLLAGIASFLEVSAQGLFWRSIV